MTKLDKTNRSAGGYARAASLSPERRKEISRNAVAARWANYVPKPVTNEQFKKKVNAFIIIVKREQERLYQGMKEEDSNFELVLTANDDVRAAAKAVSLANVLVSCMGVLSEYFEEEQ